MRAADYPCLRGFAAIVHRGGAAYGPNLGRENTMHAFGQAVALGFDYLETDLHTTADGTLVAFHDADLCRVTGQPGRIADYSAAQVAEFRVGGIDPIPTFEEILAGFPGVRLNLDIKDDRAVEPLVRSIRRHGIAARVCVGSFGPRRLWRFRRLMGTSVATAAGRLGVAWATLAARPMRLVRTPAPAFQVPLDVPRPGGGRIRVLTPRLIAAAHAAERVVHAWTVDDAETMNRLIDEGVDGIVTDRIDVLKDVLTARGMWEGTR